MTLCDGSKIKWIYRMQLGGADLIEDAVRCCFRCIYIILRDVFINNS